MKDDMQDNKPKLTIEKQTNIAAKLANLPRAAAAEMSMKEFVAGLKDQIKFAESQGYTLVEIAEILKKDGVEMSVTTLRTYLQKSKVTRKKAAPKAAAAPADTIAAA